MADSQDVTLFPQGTFDRKHLRYFGSSSLFKYLYISVLTVQRWRLIECGRMYKTVPKHHNIKASGDFLKMFLRQTSQQQSWHLPLVRPARNCILWGKTVLKRKKMKHFPALWSNCQSRVLYGVALWLAELPLPIAASKLCFCKNSFSIKVTKKGLHK